MGPMGAGYGTLDMEPLTERAQAVIEKGWRTYVRGVFASM